MRNNLASMDNKKIVARTQSPITTKTVLGIKPSFMVSRVKLPAATYEWPRFKLKIQVVQGPDVGDAMFVTQHDDFRSAIDGLPVF